MERTRTNEFVSFALIGLLNTGVHLGVLIALVEHDILSSSYANVAAFLCANLASYCLNSRVTFRQRSTWCRYLRFLMCGAIGAALSYLIARLAEMAHWHYLVGFGLTVLVMPPVNFLLARKFAFNKKHNLPA
jgi:putative flippase GtrA